MPASLGPTRLSWPAKADLVFTDPPIAIYTWDVAFRAATVVGFFGGGGMGLVTVAELGSGCLRSRVHDWR